MILLFILRIHLLNMFLQCPGHSIINGWVPCCTSMRLWSPDKLKQPPSIYGDKCNWQLAGTKIGSSETQLGTASGQLEARGKVEM